jgi:hypothetical protein
MIIVLCPLKSNRVDRWNFTDEIQRELGYWKDDERLLDKLPEYKFMPNTKLETKLPVVACFEGHINIWKRIIDEDLKDVLVVEDDSDIDYDAYYEFLKNDKPDGLIYLGGRFDYPKIKDWTDSRQEIQNYMKGKSVSGFNQVTDDFIITGAHGYFIKDKSIAEKMLQGCKGKTGKYKSNLLDVCIAKININKYYYYPSIVNVIVSNSLIKGKIILNTTSQNYM